MRVRVSLSSEFLLYPNGTEVVTVFSIASRFCSPLDTAYALYAVDTRARTETYSYTFSLKGQLRYFIS